MFLYMALGMALDMALDQPVISCREFNVPKVLQGPLDQERLAAL